MLPFCLWALLLPVATAVGAQTRFVTLPEESRSADFTLPDFSGQNHTLADYRGKVVLVNFWASWCPPCVYEMPAMMQLKQRLHDRPFEILALNVGEKKYKVMKFVKLVGFELPVLLDQEKDAFRAWGVRTLPTSFLVDARGKVRYFIRGDPGWNDPGTVRLIEQLLPEPGAIQLDRDPSPRTDNARQ